MLGSWDTLGVCPVVLVSVGSVAPGPSNVGCAIPGRAGQGCAEWWDDRAEGAGSWGYEAFVGGSERSVRFSGSCFVVR